MALFTLDATLLEVAKAHLRDAFVCAQPALTRSIRAIFVGRFGEDNWLQKFKCYIGPSMQAFAVDDGRAFDIFSLCEVLQGSMSDIKSAIALDQPAHDQEYQKLQFIVNNVSATRNWHSHEFSVTVYECQHAITSLIELCGMLQRRVGDVNLDDGFNACVTQLCAYLDTIDQLQQEISSHDVSVKICLRLDQAASILLMRSFERLCVAAEDINSSMSMNTESKNYNVASGCMRYTDVVDVIYDMKHSKNMKDSKTPVKTSVKTPDYDFLITGRNLFFHGTQPNITFALIFCIGAVARILPYVGGPTANAACSSTVAELLSIFQHLKLDCSSQALKLISRGQGVNLSSLDPNGAEWFVQMLWPCPVARTSGSSCSFSKQECSAKFHDVFLRFGVDSVIKYCTGAFKHLKGKRVFALFDVDDVSNKHNFCNMLLACMALSSIELHKTDVVHSFGCIYANITAGSSLIEGKRAPEQRDDHFTGRSAELQILCGAISRVLLNTPLTSHAAHMMVLGLPGMGKSLLVSQALLKMQRLHAELHRNVYFLKLRGRGAMILEEDLVMHARSLGSKIAVTSSSTPKHALTQLKDYLSHVRFVAIIDDANDDGLEAASKNIPKSSECHAILVTSQQLLKQPSSLEVKLGPFETLTLSRFEESLSIELLHSMHRHIPALCSVEVDRLISVAHRLDHLPLGLRLFGKWSLSRYHRDFKVWKDAKREFVQAAESAAIARGSLFDSSARAMEELNFCTDHGDQSQIVNAIFNDWLSSSDPIDQELLESSCTYPRGLVGTVSLALYELTCLNSDDAEACRQLLSVLQFCPSVRTPWSLFLGHDGSCVGMLERITRREDLSRVAELLHNSGLIQVHSDCFSMHQLLQRAVRRFINGGVDAAVRLIDKRIGLKELSAVNAYREILPAVHHILKELCSMDASCGLLCEALHLRIVKLLKWMGGSVLEVEIRRMYLREKGSDAKNSAHTSLRKLADSLSRIGLYDEALVCYKDALTKSDQEPPDFPMRSKCLLGAAWNLYKLGRYDESLKFCETALACRTHRLPTNHSELKALAEVMLDTANCHAALGWHSSALNMRKEVLKTFRRILPSNHVDVARALMNTAISYSATGEHAKALNLKEEALNVCRQTLPADHPAIANSLVNVSNSFFILGRHERALEFRQLAVDIYKRSLPENHPYLTDAIIAKATSLRYMQRHTEALDTINQVCALQRGRFFEGISCMRLLSGIQTKEHALSGIQIQEYALSRSRTIDTVFSIICDGVTHLFPEGVSHKALCNSSMERNGFCDRSFGRIFRIENDFPVQTIYPLFQNNRHLISANLFLAYIPRLPLALRVPDRKIKAFVFFRINSGARSGHLYLSNAGAHSQPSRIDERRQTLWNTALRLVETAIIPSAVLLRAKRRFANSRAPHQR